MIDCGLTMRHRLRCRDFYRYRIWVWGLTVLFAAGPIVITINRFQSPAPQSALGWASLGFIFAFAWGQLLYVWWPLSAKQEREHRARLGVKRPHECVLCGYNISHSPGPKCPECGDHLGDPDVSDAGSHARGHSGVARPTSLPAASSGRAGAGAGLASMNRRLFRCDFHRHRKGVLAVTAVLPLLWIGLAVVMWKLHSLPGLLRFSLIGATAIPHLGLLLFWWWPLSAEREKRLRMVLSKVYPDECLRCGYNITRSPGPKCPECGDLLNGYGRPSAPVVR